MDASALLKSQGWRGKGHSLHPTDNSIGLSNPLLLSRNTDGSGIGANKTFTDQWWLAAFDQKLKGLDTSKKGVVVQSVTAGALDAVTSGKGGRYAGLYASFVKGGLMEGTISPESGREGSTDATPVSEDRESVPGLRKGMAKRKETKEERRARKEAKRLKRVARDERKAAKEQRRAAKAEQRKKAETKDVQMTGRTPETKQERRARRAERRLRKEARRKRREENAARKAAKG
jgi:nucleolar protein TMA23